MIWNKIRRCLIYEMYICIYIYHYTLHQLWYNRSVPFRIINTLFISEVFAWFALVKYSKVHGANMGPICGRQGPSGPYVGPMNFAIWALILQRHITSNHTPVPMKKIGFNLNWFNILRPRQNGRHFPDNNFICIFLNGNLWISIKTSLKFVPKGPINNIRYWLPVDQATSHYLNPWWVIHLCIYASPGLNLFDMDNQMFRQWFVACSTTPNRNPDWSDT